MCGFCRWLKKSYRPRTDKKAVSRDGMHRMTLYLMRLDSEKEALTVDMDGHAMEMVIDYCPFCGRKL